jgi:hypothetical protein
MRVLSAAPMVEPGGRDTTVRRHGHRGAILYNRPAEPEIVSLCGDNLGLGLPSD